MKIDTRVVGAYAKRTSEEVDLSPVSSIIREKERPQGRIKALGAEKTFARNWRVARIGAPRATVPQSTQSSRMGTLAIMGNDLKGHERKEEEASSEAHKA